MNLFSYILEINKNMHEEINQLLNGVDITEGYLDPFWINLSKQVNSLSLFIIILVVLIIIFVGIFDPIKILTNSISAFFIFGFLYLLMYQFGPLYTPAQIEMKEKRVAEKNQEIKKRIEDEANNKIKELYNNNIQLFDNYKTNNIDEILKKVEEKEKIFNEEVTKTIVNMKSEAFEKNIFLDDEKMKPFIELYIMNKNNIPLYGKIEQEVSPEATGRICKALEIEKCWENSDFRKYNAEIKRKEKEKEEKTENKDDRYVEGFATATLLGFLAWYIIK